MDFVGGHLPELIIVLVVILIIWGPGKLPDVGAALGRGIREFRKASAETHHPMVQTTTTTPEQPAPTPLVAEPQVSASQQPAQTQATPAPLGDC